MAGWEWIGRKCGSALVFAALAGGCQPGAAPPRQLSTTAAVASATTAEHVSPKVNAPALPRANTNGKPSHDQEKQANDQVNPAPVSAAPVADLDQKVSDLLEKRGAKVTRNQRSGKISQIFAGRQSSPGSKTAAEDVALIGGLSGVSMLYLDGIGLHDTDMQKLASLRGIMSLDVSKNDITDEGLAVIKQFPGLDILNVSGSKVADATLCAVAKTARWRAFWADDSLITDRGAECLAHIKSLMHLHLAGTKISNVGLAYLAQLRGLLELSLARTEINDNGLMHLGGLSALRELDLSGCAIKGPGLVSLQGLPLQWLKLNETPLTDEAIPMLAGLSKGILVIELRGTKISPEGFVKIKQAFPDSSIRHAAAPKLRDAKK